MPNAVNAGERERGQCHVPRPDTWRAGMADGGTGAGGEKRSTVSIRASCRTRLIKRVRQCDSADRCEGDERGQCHVPGVWRAGRESWRTEAQGRAERSGRR